MSDFSHILDDDRGPVVPLEIYFQQFGSDCVKEIQKQIDRYGSIENFLRRLSIPVIGGPNHHRAALRDFLHHYGVAFFFKAAAADFDPDVVERMKTKRLLAMAWKKKGVEPEPGALKGKPREAVADTGEKPEADATTRPPPETEAESPPLKSTTGEPDQSAAQEPSVPGSDKPSPPEREVEWIETEGYSGPERRNLPDRRVGPVDRREHVEVIKFPNRRFGGVRRKVVRRKADREKSGNKNTG
jgi:hypothetical protein